MQPYSEAFNNFNQINQSLKNYLNSDKNNTQNAIKEMYNNYKKMTDEERSLSHPDLKNHLKQLEESNKQNIRVVAKALNILFLDSEQKDTAEKEFNSIIKELLRGDIDVVREMIKSRAINPNMSDANGFSLLHYAIFENNFVAVKMLVEYANINNKNNEEGMTPLHYAAAHGNKEISELLINKKADVNAKDEHGFTSLYYAATNGHKLISEWLMAVGDGDDLDTIDKDGLTLTQHVIDAGELETLKLLIRSSAHLTKDANGLTAIHHAVVTGQLEILKLLINKPAYLNIKDDNGMTPLQHAIANEDSEISKWLIENGADVNAENEEGRTPLHYAAIKGLREISELLLERGADVNAADDTGQTPLHDALDNEHIEICKILIEKGADVDAKNEEGRTPLHYAAILGLSEIFELLLERGADVNAADDVGHTPLHDALDNGHIEIGKKLIEKGADVNAKNEDGETPLHYAALAGLSEISALLVDRGADVNAADDVGQTPLHSAAIKGLTEISALLVDRGADVNAADDVGQTPLHSAAIKGLTEISALLVDKGANVNAANDAGCTPLHYAAIKGMGEISALLLDGGAHVNAVDNEGQTSLHHAAMEGYLETSKLLIARGADVNLPDDQNYTALDYAKSTREKKSNELLNFFKENHPKVNAENKYLRRLIGVGQAFNLEGVRKIKHLTSSTSPRGVELEGYWSNEWFYKWAKHLTPNADDKKIKSLTFTELYPGILSSARANSIQDAMQFAVDSTEEETLQRINMGLPTFINAGFVGHAVTLLVWGNQLMICNRGGAKRKSIEIYTFDKKFTLETLLKIQIAKKGDREAYTEFILPQLPSQGSMPNQVGLSALLGFRILQTDLQKKLEQVSQLPDQVVGNCSWISPVTGIYGMMLIGGLFGETNGKLNPPPATIDDQKMNEQVTLFDKWLAFEEMSMLERYLKPLKEEKRIFEQDHGFIETTLHKAFLLISENPEDLVLKNKFDKLINDYRESLKGGSREAAFNVTLQYWNTEASKKFLRNYESVEGYKKLKNTILYSAEK